MRIDLDTVCAWVIVCFHLLVDYNNTPFRVFVKRFIEKYFGWTILVVMGQRKTTLPTRFSRAVNEEIRVLMVRNGITQVVLEQQSGISQSLISKTIYKNESSLNTNQLEAIAKVLRVKPSAILRKAEATIIQDDFALAANTSDEPKGADEIFE